MRINTSNNRNQSTIDVMTLEDPSSSIRKLVNDRLGFFTSTTSRKNTELYTVIFPLANTAHFKELKQHLRDMGGIQYFNIFKIAEPSLQEAPKLTHREEESMRYAWRNGYFNYPKNADLENIASNLSLTKSTVDFYIRRGVKKSIEYLINSEVYDWT